MKLLGRTERKVTKHKISENVTHLENIDVVLAHFNVVKRITKGFQINRLVKFYKFHQKNTFSKMFNSEFLYIEV